MSSNQTNYELHPLISLANIGITVFVCLLGVPFAFILTWKTHKSIQFYSISIQIRVQILAWTFLLTDILLMNLYLLYCMFFIEDDDIPLGPSLYEYVAHKVGDPTPEFNDRIIFGKFKKNSLNKTFKLSV